MRVINFKSTYGPRPEQELLLLTGETTAAERRDILSKVQQPGYKYILFASIKVGGVGLNLVTATAAIFMDLQWNPAVEQQARDRLHRIGQTQPVTVYRMVTDLKIDQFIKSTQNRKKNASTAILFGTQVTTTTTQAMPTIDDMMSIFNR